MEDNRRRDNKTNQDISNRNTQHQNRRHPSQFEFEGMNYEQQRESYRMGKPKDPETAPADRINRRRVNDN